jgi:WD40-like Beta Propeller Repeat
MATIAPPRPPVLPDTQTDRDALIKEARDRQRRRRRRGAGLLILVAAAAGLLAAVIGGREGAAPAVVRVPGGPTVNIAPFAGYGRLAFISGAELWVLDGEKHSLRQIAIATGSYPSQPLFSSDGRWLAFVRGTTPPSQTPGAGAQIGQLWLARGDGSDAHPVRGLAHAIPIGWSSATDELAVIAGPISTRVPFESLTTVRVVTPTGGDRLRVRARGVQSAAWSPDGRSLAVATEDGHQHFTVASYGADGGPRQVWGRFGPRTHLNGMTQIVVDVAGWWRGLGVGIWVYGNGMVHNNDATPLDLISARAAAPRYLVSALSDGTTRVIAAGRGKIAVVADVSHGVNGGRVVWDAKQVEICTRVGCSPVRTAKRRVTLDPAWSANGRFLAYVQAPDRTSGPWSQAVVGSWYAEHQLRVLDTRAGVTRKLGFAGGATVPIWSPDGRSLLFVDKDAIWLLPRLDSEPVEIARPLFKGTWPNYYGQMAWSAQFAWWAR